MLWSTKYHQTTIPNPDGIKMAIVRNKFDFDVGHLVKSPCINCKEREKFPKCADKCSLLEKLRTVLAAGISSTYSSYEP